MNPAHSAHSAHHTVVPPHYARMPITITRNGPLDDTIIEWDAIEIHAETVDFLRRCVPNNADLLWEVRGPSAETVNFLRQCTPSEDDTIQIACGYWTGPSRRPVNSEDNEQ